MHFAVLCCWFIKEWIKGGCKLYGNDSGFCAIFWDGIWPFLRFNGRILSPPCGNLGNDDGGLGLHDFGGFRSIKFSV